jgi:hypothetical protein
MSATISSAPLQESPRHASRPAPALVVLVGWLAVILALGANSAFLGPRGAPPIALLIAFVVPIASSVLAFRFSARFREWVLGIEPRLLVAMQAWRFGGLSFIALYAHGILPGFFAWPAGLGDMAIGLTAPWVLSRMSESPAFASSRAFLRWNVLGLLDLFVAISLGALGAFLGAGQSITTAPMGALPLVLIPAFLVPIFILMHLAVLAQMRRPKA